MGCWCVLVVVDLLQLLLLFCTRAGVPRMPDNHEARVLAWLRGRPGKEEGPEAGVRSLCALAHYVTPALTCLRLPASSIYLHASSIMVPLNNTKTVGRRLPVAWCMRGAIDEQMTRAFFSSYLGTLQVAGFGNHVSMYSLSHRQSWQCQVSVPFLLASPACIAWISEPGPCLPATT